MDVLSKLPTIDGEADEDTRTDEEIEAEAKAERIRFHRTSVRNGPVSWKTTSTGQARRARKRALARDTKKARRTQIRRWRADRQEEATLRGYLQAAAVLPYSTDFEPSGDLRVAAITWLVQHHMGDVEVVDGRVTLTREVVVGSIERAFQRWQTLTGQPVTPLSPAYVLPVALAA